ncbi:Enterobacteriaceae phage serine recombinase [Frankia sp. AiPs1]|nr:recombinase family protein [Frankia sp. AiPa1]MCL9762084.1 recombinase family protein [Frankia sp. AiPa1]
MPAAQGELAVASPPCRGVLGRARRAADPHRTARLYGRSGEGGVSGQVVSPSGRGDELLFVEQELGLAVGEHFMRGLADHVSSVREAIRQILALSRTVIGPFAEMIAVVTAAIEPTELLVAEPAVLTYIRIGYARVSTGGQKLERQIDALTAAGCRRIFAEKQSGRDTDRPELAACLDFTQPGDTLVVPALDRLSRSLQDLIATVGDLRRRGVGFTSLHENLDTTTPGGRLVFHVFAALAEFIRELIVTGTREGLAAARERGRVGGRPTVATPEIIRAARDMLPNPDASVTSIAKLLGVSPGTLYNHIPDLRELRATGRARHELTAASPATS